MNSLADLIPSCLRRLAERMAERGHQRAQRLARDQRSDDGHRQHERGGQPLRGAGDEYRRLKDVAALHVPVIAPVGVGSGGETYNINADLVAGAMACLPGDARYQR